MTVSPIFTERWRSGRHVGAAKPTTVVRIQRGLLDRAYRPFRGDDTDFGVIANSKHNEKPWHAFWRATGPWLTVPNVQHVETTGEFQQQSGVADPDTCTIAIDNIIYQQAVGPVGTFRRFLRGWMSPLRGWTNLGARDPDPGAPEPNEWFDVLNGGYRVRVWQGYGDALEPVFTGLIDDTDVSVTPDTITLTCRNFGQVLTDSRVFGSNKANELKSPIVFADRQRADKTKKEGGAARASSSHPGHPAVGVTKPGSAAFWLSAEHTTPGNTEWVEVRLPKGRYETFYVAPGYEGMEMFLSLYVRKNGLGGKPVTVDGEPVDEGWVFRGLGEVPGGHGGFPMVKHWPSVNSGGRTHQFGFVLETGDDTVLRVSFRGLQRSGAGGHRAKVSRLCAFKRQRKSEAQKKKWILVDDVTDVLKWVFMWAGFKNWNVEPMGIRLKNPATFHQADYLIDIVKMLAETTADYVFFIDGFDPNDEADIGTPNFVRTNAIVAPPPDMLEVRDIDLLTDIDTKFTKEPLSYIIRVRGKMAKASEGGVALGEDSVRRVMATYFPPWSGAHHDVVTGRYSKGYPFPGRLSGVRKHRIASDNNVESPDEAMMRCLLIAMQEALAALGATIEIPGHPAIALNQQISVVDTASGMNTRMWVSHRSTTWTGGEQPSFMSTLQGAMVDSPDLFMVALDYLYFLDKVREEALT